MVQMKGANMTEPAKIMLVRLEGSKPVFEFTGLWSGHDIKAVRNLLWREYLRYSRQVRLQAIEQPKEVTV